MLAAKEDYIAEFYFKREHYDSALTRYEALLAKYPGLGFDAKALSRAAVAAFKAGEPDRSRRLIKQLETKFPNSDELSEAKEGIR
jgi:outer membrane protein assembly factor BamD